MKNRSLSVYILIFLLCVLFASCGKGDAATWAETDTEALSNTFASNETDTREALTEETDAMQAPTENTAVCTVDFVREETEIYDDSGRLLLLSGQFIYPVVSMPENKTAEEAVNAYFAAEKERYYAEAERMHADSLELLGNFESDYWNTFIYDKKFTLTLVSATHLSFLSHTDIYLGGAHPTPDESGLIFDLSSGQALTMDELFTDADAMRAHVLPIIKKDIEKGMPFDNYEEFLPDIVDEGTFYLDSDGVTFICNVYVLFPYAYGISYYSIPYDEIGEFLNFEPKESASFSRFYSFDIDGEDSERVLGYVDTRESSCPYDETDIYTADGDARHVCYIIPKHEGSDVFIERVLYDENANETGTEICETFGNTGKDFCLLINCPMSEDKPLYRIVTEYNGRKASFDLIYGFGTEKPVKLIIE